MSLEAFKLVAARWDEYPRTITVALSICYLLASPCIVSCEERPIQVKPPAGTVEITPRQQILSVNQMVLTEQKIQGFIAASQAINEITDNSPDDIDRLGAATVARLDVVAKRNGLSDYEEYRNSDENIGLVTAGIDPLTKKYIGREAVIKVQMARAMADKKMSPEAKKEKLTDIKDQLQFRWPAIQNKANIGLVAKYYDKLSAVARGD